MPLTKDQKRRFHRAVIQKNSNLPASFDECMAFFTGYKATSITAANPAEFIALARSCVAYCDKMHDKESLHLLMYAIIRRTIASDNIPWFGVEGNLLNLLDMVVGDSKGIYQDNETAQVNDLAVLFQAWLSYAEQKKLDKINHQVLERGAPAAASTRNAWHETFSVECAPGEEIPFTRGGGLYLFLDCLKGISPGLKIDNDDLKGIYVTPKGTKGESTDRFYAYEAARARRFLDKPSQQKGTITPAQLKVANHNYHEAFIEAEQIADLKKTHRIKLGFFPEARYPVGYHVWDDKLKEIEAYLPPGSDAFLKRSIHLVSFPIHAKKIKKELPKIVSRDDELDARREILDKKLKPYIETLRELCAEFIVLLESDGKRDSEAYRKLNVIYSSLFQSFSASAKIIATFRENIEAGKTLLLKQDSPLKDFTRRLGVKFTKTTMVLQPDLFFSSRAQLSKLEKALKRAEAEIEVVISGSDVNKASHP